MTEHSIVDLVDDNCQPGHDDVSSWTSDKVKGWFRSNGYKEYESVLASNPVNGETLLTFTRDSLQKSPFHMTDSQEIDHLHSSIEALRKKELKKYMNMIVQNGIKGGFHKNDSQHKIRNGRTANGHAYTEIEMESDSNYQYPNGTTPLLLGGGANGFSEPSISEEQYPSEKLKTFVAFLYMFLGFIVTVVTRQFVHERVPEDYPPLPDIAFDIVPNRFTIGIRICEYAGMILFAHCGVLFVIHKHRFIICRRLFFLIGTLYLYRSLTIYVTTLPVSKTPFTCASKTGGKLSVMLGRAAGILLGGGLNITGSNILCGDYLFSGHTIVLVLTYHVITENTPKRWWLLHWFCWCVAAIGIICILLGHEHYTVDVIVAYLLTSRLFWAYHTMCYMAALKDGSESNMLSRAWWFPLFRYFEGNVSSNGRVPCQYEWPLPWPHQFQTWLGQINRPWTKRI